MVAPYRLEGEAAWQPLSRRPKTSPNATPSTVVELIIKTRRTLTSKGLDAGRVVAGGAFRGKQLSRDKCTAVGQLSIIREDWPLLVHWVRHLGRVFVISSSGQFDGDVLVHLYT